jgi:hypothetical protein
VGEWSEYWLGEAGCGGGGGGGAGLPSAPVVKGVSPTRIELVLAV